MLGWRRLMQSKQITLMAVLGALSALALFPHAAFAQADDIKHHGDYLYQFEQYQLEIEELDGWITIKLIKKNRIPGGPEVFETPNNPFEYEVAGLFGNEPIIRFAEPDELARLRSDVVIPAEPNYVRNPGQRYKITVQGLSVAPDYYNVFEVDAGNALAAVQDEAFKLYARAPQNGPEQEAIYMGILLGMRALNESGRLPAPIPLTVLRSDVGQFRIGPNLGRREVGRTKRFTDVSEGQEAIVVQQEESELANMLRNTGPAYRRGVVTSPGGETSTVVERNNLQENIQTERPGNAARMEQVQGIQAQKDAAAAEKRPFVEPLTAGDSRFRSYGPLGASQAESIELLTGKRYGSTADAKVQAYNEK